MAPRKNKIVFIESSPLDLVAKFSKLLKEEGYHTTSLILTGENHYDFFKRAYNERISFKTKFFPLKLSTIPKLIIHLISNFPHLLKTLIRLKKINPDIVIQRTAPNWFCVLMEKFIFTKSNFIYFPHDFRSLPYRTKQEYLNDLPLFELESERYCFENLDGIIYKGVENKFDYIDKDVFGGGLKITAPKLHIFPYCSKELLVPISKEKLNKKFKKGAEISVVFIGHLDVHPTWIKTFEMITSQKIHVHAYCKSANQTREQSLNKKEYTELMESPYFHIHEPVDQSLIAKEISQYDFGIWPGYFDSKSKNIKYDTGNKFSTWIEAGLPIIHFKNHEYIGQSINQYGAGVPITIDSPLRKILEKQNYRNLLRKIDKGRKKILWENQLKRIEEFFNHVRNYKLSKDKK